MRGQQRDLADILDSGTLRNHAEEVLAACYRAAAEDAAIETGLPQSSFPATCTWDVDELLLPDVT